MNTTSRNTFWSLTETYLDQQETERKYFLKTRKLPRRLLSDAFHNVTNERSGKRERCCTNVLLEDVRTDFS